MARACGGTAFAFRLCVRGCPDHALQLGNAGVEALGARELAEGLPERHAGFRRAFDASQSFQRTDATRTADGFFNVIGWRRMAATGHDGAAPSLGEVGVVGDRGLMCRLGGRA
jgi:hypothetical protein